MPRGRQDISADADSLQSVEVSTTTPADNQVLTYDSATGKWGPEAAAGGQTTIVDLLGSDQLGASHDYTDGVAFQGWQMSNPQTNDIMETDASGDLLMHVNGSDGLQSRELVATITLPAPPPALLGLKLYAKVDFTYNSGAGADPAGCSVTTAESEFMLALHDTGDTEIIELEYQYSGAIRRRLIRDLGTDGGPATAQANNDWTGNADEHAGVVWSPDRVGAIIGNATPDSNTLDMDVRRVWDTDASSIKVIIKADPDHADDYFNIKISTLYLAF